jgi:hypothetical protein
MSLDLYEGQWNDTSWENQYEATVDKKGSPNVIAWMEVPEIKKGEK